MTLHQNIDPAPRLDIGARYPFTLWLVLSDYAPGTVDTSRAPAGADTVAIFDDAVDEYAERMDDPETVGCWVCAINLPDISITDVTHEARAWLRARLNQRRQQWPAWL